MIRHHVFGFLGLGFVLASGVCAQRQASTLEVLTRRAPLILEIQIATIRHVNDEMEVSFRPLRALRGTVTAPSLLRESNHRHCGGSCQGLVRGQRIVLFAEEREGRLLPRGGSRGLVPVGDGEFTAIDALVRTRETAARIRLLAAQLGHRSPRVREDAALALPFVPGLEQVDPATKAVIGGALEAASREPDGPRTFGLLMTAARVLPAKGAETAWKLLLDRKRTRLHGFAERYLREQLPGNVMVGTAPITARDVRDRILVARVLGRSRLQEARASLERLTTDDRETVRFEAVSGLLRLGVDAKSLEVKVGRRLVATARATLVPPRPRFRAIRPR